MDKFILEKIFPDSAINEAVQDLVDLNKVVIESYAANVHNDVIFEYALSEAIALTEAEDDDKSKFSNVKNAIYKMLETFQRAAKALWSKSKIAINEFIAKANARHVDSLMKDFDEVKSYFSGDLSSLGISHVKSFEVANENHLFSTDSDLMNTGTTKGSEEELAKYIVGKIIAGAASETKKQLEGATSLAAISKVLMSVSAGTGVYDRVQISMLSKESEGGNIFESKKVAAEIKNGYNDAVKATNEFIKKTKSGLNNLTTDAEIEDAKKSINLANKMLSYYNAAFIGRIKLYVARNSRNAAIIKKLKSAIETASKKKAAETKKNAPTPDSIAAKFAGETKQEAAVETFMGLALL